MQERKKYVEEHYDDCGENVDQLALVGPPDTDDELEYEAMNFDISASDPWLSYAFPIDVATVARANPAAVPDVKGTAAIGAVNPQNSTCKGCRGRCAKDGWTHSRELGECQWPGTEPFIPECEACVNRLPLRGGTWREAHIRSGEMQMVGETN